MSNLFAGAVRRVVVGRAVSRLATLGLALVLLLLTAFAMGSAVVSKRAADKAQSATAGSVAYGRARFAVAEEESLERKYRLEPGPAVRRRYNTAAHSLVVALENSRRIDHADTREVREIGELLQVHRRYLAAINRMFKALDAQRPALVLAIDGGQVDPRFGRIEQGVESLALVHQRESVAALRTLHKTEDRLLIGTPIVFAAGLLLIALLGQILFYHRRRAETELRTAEKQYRSLVEGLPLVTYLATLSESRSLLYVSPQISSLLGYAVDALLAEPELFGRIVHPDDRARVLEGLGRTRAHDEPFRSEYRLLAADGRVVWVEDDGVVERDEQTGTLRLRGYLLDISDRKEAERVLAERDEQLRQAQKLEAVGQLAGGVAHDFNNLLTAILGYSELLAQRLDGDVQAHEDIRGITHAAERAKQLTSQLLAFSRKQVLRTSVLDLNEIVDGMKQMLRRLIGEDVELVTSYFASTPLVKLDRGQLEQVLLNLAVNARDAMPTGGRLSVETATVDVDAAFAAQHPPIEPGRFVLLRVGDSGTGMDAETLAHVFEPFFTTKEVGKGTGLGLATVYGIVKQSGGSIFLESAPGRGTTFSLYFPEADEVAAPAAASFGNVAARGGETILLVEDEAVVRDVTTKLLEKCGYRVLSAGNSDEAVRVSEGCERPIDLLVTDVVIPGENGRALAERLTSLRPELKVLYVSGYADDAVVRNGVSAGSPFLQKPFRTDELATKIRQILDADLDGSGLRRAV